MKRHLIIYIALLLSIVGCRTDDYIVYMEEEDIGIKTEPTDVLGMYVLNEGNMGSNKCTLDYLDLSGETFAVVAGHQLFEQSGGAASE